MPPKKAKNTGRKINVSYSDDSDDSDTNQHQKKSKKSAKNQKRTPRPAAEPSPENFSDDAVSDNDIYDDDNRAYMKIANEVVMKNVKLPALFDPNVLPGFTALINNTSKISAASRVLEASFKVYGKRVDVVHTEARKLDHDVVSRVVEDERQKKKAVVDPDAEQAALDQSLNEWGGNDPGFFSEQDEDALAEKKQKQKDRKSMNVDMTMANFDGDNSFAAGFAKASNSDTSFHFDDDNLRRKLMTIAKDRTVLMGNQHRSTKEIEKRLKRANDAGMEYYRKELLKRGGNGVKNAKKETGEEKESTSDYSYFHNSYYQYALNKKREKRHVCIDDVAATTIDGARIYMHNEWGDEENEQEPLPAESKEKKEEGPYDGDFLFYPETVAMKESKEGEKAEDNADIFEDVDIIDAVLEQFQGTLELSTANTHKLEPEWVEIFGLERKDLRPSNKTDISFEQTANDDFDPDKRLVDRLVIEGEDEAMKAEEDRIETLVKELYCNRLSLPGGPGHPNENSIRRHINSPPPVKMYQDEDVFFSFDQAKHITPDSLDSQIAVSRSYFIKHTNIKDAKVFGIPDKLFEALQGFALPITPLHEDIVKLIETLPNHIFVKGLFTNRVSKFEYNQGCQLLSSSIIPFRMARYCEQLINSVIHQVQSFNLKPEFFESRSARAHSTRPHSSLYPSATPTKKSRYDETLLTGETYRYFAAFELEKKQKYPNQVFNNGDDTQIYKVVSILLSSERGASAFLPERINFYYSPQAIYNFFAYTKFFVDNRNKDFSSITLTQELPSDIELNDFEKLSSVERHSEERELLLENLNIQATPSASTDAPVPMEIDNVFDNDFDYHDAPSSPFKDNNDAAAASTSQRQVLESQDIFAQSDNDNGGAYEDADDYGENFFNVDAQQQPEGTTTGTLDDSLAMVVRRSDVEPIVSTRPKRNAKKIQFVDDDAHWERPADTTRKSKKKKTATREELQEQRDDSLLFAPRETFANVTTSRRRTPSASSATIMEESPRISRCQDSSLPAKIAETKFAYRLELGQTIPGYADSDKVFFPVRFSEHMKKAFSSTSVLYRGQFSYLPPFSRTRQEDEYLFWLRTFRLCDDLTEAKKAELKTRKSLEAAAAAPFTDNANHMDYDGVSDDDYHDAADNDFDAFDGPSSPVPPPTHSQPRISTQYAGSLMGEYQQYHDDEDGDEEIDDFDFESKRDKAVTLHYSEGRLALKRAIRYILTKSRYDRSTLPDEISGIKVPPPQITDELVQTQMLPHSTPTAMKKTGRFQFEIDEDGEDEIIGGDNLLNGLDVDEESDYENDTDETRMKDFKIDGFHTLKSLLFYLPDVCHPDTVRILSVAHVFCTLCHMANENNLHFIQEEIELDGGETTSDCRILNLEDAEVLEIENGLDDEMDFSEEMSDT